MRSEFGARLRLAGPVESVCDGQLEVFRWSLSVDAGDAADLAIEVGRSYVSDQALLATPAASLGSKVPAAPNVRKGDFGELVAMGIYSARMGAMVPYRKLLLKPVAGATVQGPDTVTVTITPGEDVDPVVVEAKYRTSGQPSHVLPAIQSSVGVLTEEYLVSAWAAGAELMLAHPDHLRHFAFTAAQHLGRLLDPGAALPPHRRHAVAVVGIDKLTKAKIEEYWTGAPPVSVLHVVVVENLDAVRDQIFDAAAKLTYADLTAGAADLLDVGSKAGVAGLISRDAPDRLASGLGPHPLSGVVEASLWYLADEDGVAKARADAVAKNSDPDVRGLAQLLTGALSGAVKTLSGRELEEFAKVAREVVDLRVEPEVLRQAALGLSLEDALTQAARHVAAALLHRLERHPATMTRAQGATGTNVQHVVENMRRFGKHAFWPSQAAAVQGGLFDAQQMSLAIQMPTSAGKTTLMQLVTAHTLDEDPSGVVAVLAPTKALIGQLYRDLKEGLPDDVEVRSSQGGLDYDTDLPSSAAVLSGPGVAILTPERFDLDWRRAVTEDGVDLDDIKLLVVDEAQHVNNGLRGATLEMVIAKALRRGIRVVLLASQFGDVTAIADWIGGAAVESGWRPAWLERHVYIRGLPAENPNRARTGYLWPEGADPVKVLDLKPSEKSKGAGCIRERRYEAAGLVARFEHEGLVVVFTDQKRYAAALLDAVMDALPQTQPTAAKLDELADRIEKLHPNEAAQLRSGFGLHHADVPRVVRQAIESAARIEGGLLRCIVCTPTLLEGVDFPTRTVIAVHPPRNAGRPDIARLRNLEGRAGRAGKFVSGRLVVQTSDHEQAHKWRRAMREKLPATETALTSALRVLATHLPQSLTTEAKDVLDAVTIEALAESAAVTGDLRAAVEKVLQRTFWSATSAPSMQDHAVDRASGYVALVAQQVPDPALRNAIYRSGLKLQGCLNLSGAIELKLDRIVELLRDPDTEDGDLDKVLHWLVHQCVTHLDELADLRDVPSRQLRDALSGWMTGRSEDDLLADHPEAWSAVKPRHLETLILWALTGAFEIVAALADDLRVRELAHQRLQPVRIRYGVPDAQLCDLVRAGFDRVDVARVAAELAQEPPAVDSWAQGPLVWAVGARLEREQAQKLATVPE